jgi:chemotaxis protein MotA
LCECGSQSANGTTVALNMTGHISETLDVRNSCDPPYASVPVMGAAFGFLIVVSSVVLSAHSFQAFFSLAGLVIVVGGVISVAFMSFQTSDVMEALHAIAMMLREPQSTQDDLHRDMQHIIGLARLNNTRGLRAVGAGLDQSQTDDPFVRYGINMVLGAYGPADIRTMMDTATDAAYEQDCVPVDVLRAMTSHAPAFGMVGTLVGMVAMLCNLHDDISSIGATLAVSFLSTLYGVISARMIYMPAASRLQQEVENRQFRYHLITEGMTMLAANETPSRIQDRLNAFLRPDKRDYFDAIARPARTAVRLIDAGPGRAGKSNATALRRLSGVTR